MAITADVLRIQHEIDSAIATIVDDQTRDLTRAWIDAWDEVHDELEASIQEILRRETAGNLVSKTIVARNGRLLQALGYINIRLITLANQAGVRILGDLRRISEQAVSAQMLLIRAQLPESYVLSGSVPGYAIDAIVARSAQQITARTFPLAPDAYEAVRRELIRGVVIGANPNLTAKKMVDRAEMRFNGGLARAVNIARTETLDAHRAASAAGQAAHTDVLTGWIWLAHLSSRTCISCIAMNGTLHPLSEPGPLDHQQGRCARMPKTLAWADLGIRSREPKSQVSDSRSWFGQLTAEQQRSILGDAGYGAWRRGEFPMERWAERRVTPGWRDSFVPRKVAA
jgi:hypothetical protein